MKIALMVSIWLFLSINLMGQIDSTSESKLDTTLMVIYDDYYNDDVYVEFNFKAYVDSKIDKRIVELWEEYQIECKSDTGSLMWHQFEFLSAETREHMVMYKTINGRSFYHRKPTLEGYMLFIKRKITSKPKTLN